jgi:CBS domain-containing protein
VISGLRTVCAFLLDNLTSALARHLLPSLRMQGQLSEPQTCLVFRGDGHEPIPFSSPSVPKLRTSDRPSATAVPLHQIMSRRLICARPDLDVRVIVRLMMKHHVGCIPVVDDRNHPVGMITKLDLLQQVDAELDSVANGSPLPADLRPRCADEIMMPLALSLSEYATVAHASAMMICEDTHHVIVVGADAQIVGVVSSRDIVAWLLETDGLTQ